MTNSGQDCKDKQKIAKQFNYFYVSIMDKISKTNQINCRFAIHSIDNTDTSGIIYNIKTSRNRGHDGISSELLKLITGDISKCITLTINQSLHCEIFPNKF